MANIRLCSIPGCGNRHHAHGFCTNHREKFLRHGDPLAGRPRIGEIVDVDEALRMERRERALCEECGSPEFSRGFCRTHYHRRMRRGLLNKVPRQQQDRLVRPKRERGPVDPARSRAYQFLKASLSAVTQDCIEWPFHKNPRGYGRLGDGRAAHRVMCEMAHGEPPFSNAQAAHWCGDASCVNPRHLRWATPKENEQDKYRHGTRRRTGA